MKNDLELLPITFSLRGRAKSSRTRRQGQNCRRRSQSYIEDDFDPTIQESSFAAGRSRAGCWDTLKNMQNEPNFKNTKMNLNLFKTKKYEKNQPFARRQNEPNSNPIYDKMNNEQVTHFNNLPMINDLELLPINGSLRGRATSDENRVTNHGPRATNKKMQNEPNLQNAQMNLTSFPTSNYGKFRRRQRPKNEPNTNPILPTNYRCTPKPQGRQERLTFQGRFDILLKISLSGITERV